jgi:uncharacterized protein
VTSYFLDTSAIAKRYLIEAGSSWVTHLLQPESQTVVIVSDLASVEMASLLARRVRNGDLGADNATRLLGSFLLHADDEYLMVPLDGTVLEHARTLVARYPLRTLDAIQLASAQRTAAVLGEALTFVTGDHALLAAATAEGMATEDPLSNP